MRRAAAALALLVLAGPPLAGPAVASPVRAADASYGARTTAGAVRAQITFDKDPRHPWHGELVWRAWRQRDDGTWRLIERQSWRAGSGFGGPQTTDECARGKGWLPDGRYSFVQYDDYWGDLIKGRVFFLGSHACRNGTMRTELFIHTETGAHNRQCTDRPGDQLCRWEWPRINDYRSAGCIKMAPGDLLALTRHYHRWFRPGVRYAQQRVGVRVIA